MTTDRIYLSCQDNIVEEYIRSHRAWWLPITLSDRLDHQLRNETVHLKPTSTGRRLPSDVALWLAELRHSSDSDEFISGLKLNVECENVASEVWLIDKDCSNQTEEVTDHFSAFTSQLSTPVYPVQEAVVKIEESVKSQINIQTSHNETDIHTVDGYDNLQNGVAVSSITDAFTPNPISSILAENEQVKTHAKSVHDWNLDPGNSDECFTTSLDFRILQDHREVKDCELVENKCKEDIHFSWNVNPMYSGSVINIAEEGGKCHWGADCNSGRGTLVRKLCHSALEELCILSNVGTNNILGLCAIDDIQDNGTLRNNEDSVKNKNLKHKQWENKLAKQHLSNICDYDITDKNETNTEAIVQCNTSDLILMQAEDYSVFKCDHISNCLLHSTGNITASEGVPIFANDQLYTKVVDNITYVPIRNIVSSFPENLENSITSSYKHDNVNIDSSSSYSENNTHFEGKSMNSSNTNIYFAISEEIEGNLKCSLSHLSDDKVVDALGSNIYLLENTNNIDANNAMNCMINNVPNTVDNTYTHVLKDLECMLHTLQGMEDSSTPKNELLDYQDPELLLLFKKADDLIEETLLQCTNVPQRIQHQKPQSVASSTLSDDVFLTSPNSLPEDVNVFVIDSPILKTNNININNIFDDGTGPPVPPIRRKKIMNGCLLKYVEDIPFKMSDSNLKTEDTYQTVPDYCAKMQDNKSCTTVFSNSEISKDCKVAELNNQCKECLASSDDYLKYEIKIRSISNNDNTDTLCEKKLNINHPEMSEEYMISQPNVNIELNTSLLENSSDEYDTVNSISVAISQTKPISSFEFPPDGSKSKTIQKPENYFGHVVKQQRPVSSLDDCTINMYDEQSYGSLGRSRKGSGASDITAWKQDLQRAGLFGHDDDEWFSSNDSEGRVYLFDEHISESTWRLPKINITECEIPGKNTLSIPVIRNQDGDKRNSNRLTKARSMVLASSKWKDNSNKSSSIHGNWPQLLEGNMRVLKEGVLNRTKITENGKKVRKNWAPAHVVLTELFLLFFKDNKSFLTVTAGRPELCVDLNGTLLDPGNKMSSRKNVSMVSTVLGLQVLFQCDDTHLAHEWYLAISSAIKNLPSSYDRCPRNPTPIYQIKSLNQESSDTSVYDEQKRDTYILCSKSVKIKHRNESVEDLMSSQEEQQTKIRDRLKKFFHRRPTRETLVRKGIYKDEPVFGCHLSDVCPDQPPYIPRFVKICIDAIERNEENMNSDGLYRASGNLSQVQKIRLQVDQNKLTVLDEEEDVHVLTGTLKLFFRELKKPLIPYELFNKALKAVGMNQDKKDKIQQFQEIVRDLPRENHDTLKFLLEHLFRVTLHKESNRMHIPNVAIVFGPTLMWPEEESQNMALDLMQQNLVIEFFLLELDEIFR